MDELTSCTTHDNAILKLRGQLSELDAALGRAHDLDDKFANSLREVAASRQALNEIRNFYRELVGNPILQQEFLWDWYDLETSVPASLGRVETALTAQKKKLAQASSSLSIKADNLRSNLSTVENIPCILSGVWRGNFSFMGASYPMMVHVAYVGGKYTVDYSINNRSNLDICVDAVDAGSRKLNFRASCRPPSSDISFNLTFSSDFKSLSGMRRDASDPDAAALISLKQ